MGQRAHADKRSNQGVDSHEHDWKTFQEAAAERQLIVLFQGYWFLFFVIYSVDKLYYIHWSAEVKTILYFWNKSDLATVYNSI